ncbi:MAG: hypothetical protein PHP85_07395 [Gallionella sp.]|nr:hypothetical protein [Gallionella sp.]
MLLMLAVSVFYPLFFTGFTTRDDAEMANWGGSVWQTADMMAKAQGRFSFFWCYPALHLPYLFDDRFYYLAVKYGSFLLLLLSIYFCVSTLFKSRWIATVALFFFLSFIQNGWDHNALTSYPFVFNFCAILFLVSLGFFATAIERDSFRLAIFSAVLYFFALGTELFVLFFPFYVAVMLSRAAPDQPVVRKIMSGKRHILVVSLALITYLAIYVAWRIGHPSIYDGNSLNVFDLKAAGRVVASYSLNAFPFFSLSFLFSHGGEILFTDSVNIREILTELNALCLIMPMVVGFVFFRLMTSASFIVPQRRALIVGAVLALTGMFLPNLLLGFIQKHQVGVALGNNSYLYTYYSFISAVILAALLAALVRSSSASWNPGLRMTLILTGTIAVVILSFAVNVRNQYVALDQKLSHRKWQLMDLVIKSPAFMEIAEGSYVVAPTLSAHSRGIATVNADYWSNYVRKKTGRNIRFVNDRCMAALPCYMLVFRQETHSDNQFVVLAKIKNSELMASSDLSVYVSPDRAGATLAGVFDQTAALPELNINGAPVSDVGGGLFATKMPSLDSLSSDEKIARITGNVDIFPEQVTVSYYAVSLHIPRVSAELGSGFYGWETGAGQPSWAWSNSVSELHIINPGRKPVPLIVEFESASLEKIELSVSGELSRTFTITPGAATPIEFEFIAQPGVNRIGLTSNRDAIHSGSDPRLLSFFIRKLKIRQQ